MTKDFELNWTTQLRKGIYELCILNALGSSRRYGYEIVQTLRSIDSLVVSEGAIYPILNRLKREAFVKTYIEESPGGPPRKYYELTVSGNEYLQELSAYWQGINRTIRQMGK